MRYSITLQELIDRPIIRNDQPHEYMNKLTDIELDERKMEIDQILRNEGVSEEFPDWNASYLSVVIDTDIIYRLYSTK